MRARRGSLWKGPVGWLLARARRHAAAARGAPICSGAPVCRTTRAGLRAHPGLHVLWAHPGLHALGMRLPPQEASAWVPRAQLLGAQRRVTDCGHFGLLLLPQHRCARVHPGVLRGGLRMLDPRAPLRGRPCVQALAGRRVKGQVAKAVGLLGEVLCGTVVVPRARVSVVQVCGLGPAHNASGLRKHCVRPYITYRCAVLCARARAL